MRIIFMGTPDFAVPALDALAAAGHDIIAVYSQPPRPAGRGKAPRPSPVSLRDAAQQAAFAALGADIAVVAAYGLILPRPVLDSPRLGCINIHASLLPRWRGAAPIQRAILAGDAETGVTIMQMEAGLDTGPMLAREAMPIGAYDTAGILTHRLALMGADLVLKVITSLSHYRPVPQPDEGVTYAAKIDKAESRLDFSRPAMEVDRQIRAFNPAPGAFFEYGGERIRVLVANMQTTGSQDFRTDFPSTPGLVLDDQLAIGCGSGAIRPARVQRAGRGVMDAQDLLRGFPIPAGTQLA